MSKAYTNQDNIVKVIQFYKLGFSTKETSRQTCVKPVTVQSVIVKFKSCEEREIPLHLQGGGGVQRSMTGLRLTQGVDFILVHALCEPKSCYWSLDATTTV